MPGAHFRRPPQEMDGANSPNSMLSPSSSFSSGISNASGQMMRSRAPKPPPFPIIDWLATGNHLFTIGSLGYFLMNFFRLSFGQDVNSSISNGIANSFFFALAIIFILSSGFYWVDILLFPRQWTRRKYYNPLIRELEQEEIDDEEEEYILAASTSNMDFSQYNQQHQQKVSTLKPMHITIPGGKESTLYDEDGMSERWRGGGARNGVGGFSNHHRVGIVSINNPSPFNHRRKDSSEEYDEEEEENQRRRRGCCSCLPRRICPIRTETVGEIFNLCGALLNSVSTALPYALVTFKADHGVSFDSVPLSIALMDFASMTVWLISSLLVFYVWRRDKISAARELWESAEELRTGLPREKRQRAEELERIAEDVAKKNGKPFPESATPRFRVSSVKTRWIDLTNLSWWSVFCNVIGSCVYWSACIYGITISVAAAQGKFANVHQAHGANGGGWSLTPQEVQGWVQNQRTLNLLGDIVYLACAVCCELVYAIETRRELARSHASRKVQPSSSSLPPSASFSGTHSGIDGASGTSSAKLTPSPSLLGGHHLLEHPAGGGKYGKVWGEQSLQQHLMSEKQVERHQSSNGTKKKVATGGPAVDEYTYSSDHDEFHDSDSASQFPAVSMQRFPPGGSHMQQQPPSYIGPSYRFTTAHITADSVPASHRHFELAQEEKKHAERQAEIVSPFDGPIL